MSTGVSSKQNVVIFAETRAEWIMFALSLFRINAPSMSGRGGGVFNFKSKNNLIESFIVATLYSTLGVDALVHGINETEATHVITTSENLSKFDVILTIIETNRNN